MRRHLAGSDAPPGDSLASVYVAGCVGGLVCSVVTTPAELVKCRLQWSDEWPGMLSMIRRIWREEGLRGLYRGQAITALRDIPSYGLYFFVYEWARSRLAPRMAKSSDDAVPVLVAGGLAGAASWTAIYPLDVIKSRLQAQPGRYNGMLDCLRRSVAQEGLGILTRGLSATVLRAFPVNAVTFFAYEAAMSALPATSLAELLA